MERPEKLIKIPYKTCRIWRLLVPFLQNGSMMVYLLIPPLSKLDDEFDDVFWYQFSYVNSYLIHQTRDHFISFFCYLITHLINQTSFISLFISFFISVFISFFIWFFISNNRSFVILMDQTTDDLLFVIWSINSFDIIFWYQFSYQTSCTESLYARRARTRILGSHIWGNK